VRGFTPAKPAEELPKRRGPGEHLKVMQVTQDGKLAYYYTDTDELADPSTPGLYMNDPYKSSKKLVSVKTGNNYYPGGFLMLSRPYNEDAVADDELPAAAGLAEEADESEPASINPAGVTCETLEDYISEFPVMQATINAAGCVSDAFTPEEKTAFKVLSDFSQVYSYSSCDDCDLHKFIQYFLLALGQFTSVYGGPLQSPLLLRRLTEPVSISKCSQLCLAQVHSKIQALLGNDSLKLQLLQLASMEPVTKNMAIVSSFAVILFYISCNNWKRVDDVRDRVYQIVNSPGFLTC
jgi:hypothetical protein